MRKYIIFGLVVGMGCVFGNFRSLFPSFSPIAPKVVHKGSKSPALRQTELVQGIYNSLTSCTLKSQPSDQFNKRYEIYWEMRKKIIEFLTELDTETKYSPSNIRKEELAFALNYCLLNLNSLLPTNLLPRDEVLRLYKTNLRECDQCDSWLWDFYKKDSYTRPDTKLNKIGELAAECIHVGNTNRLVYQSLVDTYDAVVPTQ